MLLAEGLFWIGAIGRVSLCPRQPWQESGKFPIFVRPVSNPTAAPHFFRAHQSSLTTLSPIYSTDCTDQI